MELHFPTDIESFLESSEIGASLDFIPAQGQDLTVDNTVTWDLSMLKFLVNELDIASLRQKFESTEYFILSLKNSSLVKIEIMLNCGLKKYEVDQDY